VKRIDANWNKGQFLLIEIWPVRLLIGYTDQIALQVERPCVVDTLKNLLIPAWPIIENRAAVRAGIIKGAQLVIITTDNDDRLIDYLERKIVSWVFDFAGETGELPGFVEDSLFLFLNDIIARIDFTIHVPTGFKGALFLR
jgi:hypothetical protein